MVSPVSGTPDLRRSCVLALPMARAAMYSSVTTMVYKYEIATEVKKA